MQGCSRKPLCMASAVYGIIHLNSCSSSAPDGEVGLAISSSLYSHCRCWFLTNSFPSSPPSPWDLHGVVPLAAVMNAAADQKASEGSITYGLMVPKMSVGTT